MLKGFQGASSGFEPQVQILTIPKHLNLSQSMSVLSRFVSLCSVRRKKVWVATCAGTSEIPEGLEEACALVCVSPRLPWPVPVALTHGSVVADNGSLGMFR